MIFSWLLQTRELEEFGRELAREFASNCPASSLVGANRKRVEKKFSAALTQLHRRAVQFSRDKRPGVYKKAKMSNALKWALREQGYDNDLINEIIKGMLVAMARSK